MNKLSNLIAIVACALLALVAVLPSAIMGCGALSPQAKTEAQIIAANVQMVCDYAASISPLTLDERQKCDQAGAVVSDVINLLLTPRMAAAREQGRLLAPLPSCVAAVLAAPPAASASAAPAASSAAPVSSGPKLTGRKP